MAVSILAAIFLIVLYSSCEDNPKSDLTAVESIEGEEVLFSFINESLFATDSSCNPILLSNRTLGAVEERLVMIGYYPVDQSLYFQLPGSQNYLDVVDLSEFELLQPLIKDGVYDIKHINEDTCLIFSRNQLALISKEKVIWAKTSLEMYSDKFYHVAGGNMETANSRSGDRILLSYGGDYNRPNKAYKFDFSSLGFLDIRKSLFFPIPHSHVDLPDSLVRRLSTLTYFMNNDTVYLHYGQDTSVYKIEPNYALSKKNLKGIKEIVNLKITGDTSLIHKKAKSLYGAYTHSDMFFHEALQAFIMVGYIPEKIDVRAYNSYMMTYSIFIDLFDRDLQFQKRINVENKDYLFPPRIVNDRLYIPILNKAERSGIKFREISFRK